MEPDRWIEITPSEYAWELEALEYLKARLPDGEPFRAWSNFEFIAGDGSINEVDLLVVSLHKDEPQRPHVRLPMAELVEPGSPSAPQPDLFAVAEREQSAATTRWDRLFESDVYAAQRALAAKGAPDDDAVRAALDALYETNGRLPVLTLAKRLGVEPRHARRAVHGLQNLLNVDGYPVLRLSVGGTHVELGAALLIEHFGLKP